MSELMKKIDNVQRFELLEERLGISISSVGVALVNYGDTDDPVYYVEVTAVVIALNGGEVVDSFKIDTTATDSNGVGLGGSSGLFDSSKFFGIGRLDVSIAVYTTDVETVKIFPVKW